MGEKEIQEGTWYTALRGPRVEDQGGGRVNYPYHRVAARQAVPDPGAEGGV